MGLQNNAINTRLTLPHGCYVHITVTARNAAELIAMATSDAVLIDLTPPVIHYVIDGGKKQGLYRVSFLW